MLSVLVAGLLGIQTSQSVSVDLSIVTLPKVLSELTEQTGVPHRASQQAAGLYVFVSVKDQPAAKLRSHLAEVLHGKWSEVDGQFFFTAPTEEERYRAIREESIRKVIEAQDLSPLTDKRLLEAINAIEANRRSPAYTRSPQWSKPSNYPRPENMFLWRLLKEIGPKQLSHASSKNVLIYSSQPMAGLSKSIPGFQSALSNLKSENRQIRRLVSGIPSPSSDPSRRNPLYHPYLEPEDRLDDASDFSMVVGPLELELEADGAVYGRNGDLIKLMLLLPTQRSGSEEAAGMAFAYKDQTAILEHVFKPSQPRDIDFLTSIDKLYGFDSSESDLTEPQALAILAKELKGVAATRWLERWPTEFLRKIAGSAEKQIVAAVNRSVPGVFSELHLGAKFKSIISGDFGYTGMRGGIVRLDSDTLLLSPESVPLFSCDLIGRSQLISRYMSLAEKGQLGPVQYGEMILALEGDEDFFLDAPIQLVGAGTVSYEGMVEAAGIYSLLSPQQVLDSERAGIRLNISALPNWLRSNLISLAVSFAAAPDIRTSKIEVAVKINRGITEVMFDLDNPSSHVDTDPFSVAVQFYRAENRKQNPYSEARFAKAELLEVNIKLIGFSEVEVDYESPFVAKRIIGPTFGFSQMPKEFQEEVLQYVKERRDLRRQDGRETPKRSR